MGDFNPHQDLPAIGGGLRPDGGNRKRTSNTSIEKARQRVGRVPRLKVTAGVYKPKIKVLTGQYPQ